MTEIIIAADKYIFQVNLSSDATPLLQCSQ